MRYGMLGGEGPSPQERLEKYTGEVDWAYLKPHFASGALVWVDPSLDLVEVGRAFTEDEADKVQAWRRGGELVCPSEPHAAHWEDSQARFLALVVSPFVLIQPLS